MANPTTLLLLQTLILPTGLAILLVLVSKLVIGQHPNVRKRMTSNPFWKLQLFLHPLIVFGILDLAANSSGTSSATGRSFYACLILPFAFNFGVEPFDIPSDPLFLVCFYMHHYAVILAAATIAVSGVDNNTAAEQVLLFGRSQALLLGHAWILHTITFCTHKKWLKDKQKIFWPYVIIGFFIKMYWWYCGGITIGSHGTPIGAFSLLRLPVYVQYIGRWGLYLRLCQMTGWNQPNHPNYDAFEWNKQPVELGAFVLSYLLVHILVRSQ